MKALIQVGYLYLLTRDRYLYWPLEHDQACTNALSRFIKLAFKQTYFQQNKII